MTKSLAKAIALATVLGASASAHAVNVNHDGLGEVLLYSLYTSEEGNVTNINITNTTGFAKAVKVRFLEGQNSQEVLDFNLFLSAHDQWSGAVTQTADGAKLVTADKSCTAPAIPKGGVEFRPYAYTGEAEGTTKDNGEQSAARTRVGHIEVIEMGALKPDSNMAKWVTADHTKPGSAPANCGNVVSAYENGVWSTEAGLKTGFINEFVDEVKATGGLYGTAEVLNIEASTLLSYEALALDNFLAQDGTAPEVQHQFPGTVLPSLATGASTTARFKNGAVANYAQSLDAVSALLMKESISNNYVLDEGRGSETNWVITFPTKRLHVFDEIADKADVKPPFVNLWEGTEGKAKSCHTIKLENWDNEEYAGYSGSIDFSPSLPGKKNALCYETNILTFNEAKVLGGEFVSYNVNLAQPDFQFGWMNIAFDADGADSYVLDSLDSVKTSGLPVIGFSAMTVIG